MFFALPQSSPTDDTGCPGGQAVNLEYYSGRGRGFESPYGVFYYHQRNDINRLEHLLYTAWVL